MGYSFIPFDRNQQYLLPQNMLDWLPEDDLAYFVIEMVDQMDLSAFHAAYRQDGWGGAACLTQDEADWHHLHPMVDRATENLARAGVGRPIGSVVADAGYASRENLLEAERRREEALEHGISWSEFFIATASSHDLAREMAAGEEEVPGATPSASEGTARAGAPGKKVRAKNEAAERMEEKLKTEEGRRAYAARGKTIEPVFGQLKAALRFDRFMRRGFDACSSEWMFMCTVHNLRKLWRFQMSPAVIG